MIKLNILRAPLCAAARLLYTGAEAQWPQRLDFAGLNDEASATAVDRWGNVYVAGTISTTTEKKDFYVASYTASGVMRPNWPRRYFGPGGGDDIATSVHVDPASGNVYVGGTSYSATSGFDFCVIAYNSNGQTIWPNSGGGPGYAYHNGALRTTSTLDEGAGSAAGQTGTAFVVQVSMAVREDLSAENRFIAMTGIIAKVNVSGDAHSWRTVVFEPGSASPYNPVLKFGWPVDHKEMRWPDVPEIPQAVAIYTDNSVYVTGSTTVGDHVSHFTTVRYKPSGSLNLTPEYWIHQWDNGNDKFSSGMDIALDKVGDAYATGTVSPNGLNYGTIAIRKDADANGLPQVKWEDIWDNAFGEDIARSISLTFEVENGAVVPYVYVTGSSVHDTTTDVATIRYRGDSLQRVWANVYTPNSGVDVGLDVIGAGYCNAYVIGRSENNLFVIGYRRDGIVRLGPAVYDNNGGFDEGRMGVMVGAGALVAAGASAGTTSLLDFVSQKFAQTVWTTYPSSYTVQAGEYFSGSLSDLTASDNQYLVFKDKPLLASDELYDIRVEFSGTTNVVNPTEICVYHEGKSNPSFIQEIEVYDWITSSWVRVDSRRTTFGDSQLVLVLKDDPGRFLSAGLFKARFSYHAPASDELAWRVSFDVLSWTVLGG